MNNLYPTVHNSIDIYGLPVYEIKGNQLYPTVNNKLDSYGLPVFENR